MQGDYDINIPEFCEILTKLNTKSEVAAIAKAMYLKKTDNLLEARELLKDILIIKPHSLYGWILLSEINTKLYCWEDAENAIRQALKCEGREEKDKLLYLMEVILMEAMSKSNNKQKWIAALQLCETVSMFTINNIFVISCMFSNIIYKMVYLKYHNLQDA